MSALFNPEISITPIIPGTPGTPVGPGDPEGPADPNNPNHYLAGDGYNLKIDESYMEGGSNFQGGVNPSYRMEFLITSNDGLASVQIGGVTYPVANGSLGGFTSVAGSNGTLSDAVVVDNGDGTYTLTFTYTQGGAHSHTADGKDVADNVDSWDITVNSVNGASSGLTANVDIVDDLPFIEVVSGYDGHDAVGGTDWRSHTDLDDNVPDLVGGAQEPHSGNISMTGGLDGVSEFAVSVGVEGETRTVVVDLNSTAPQTIEGKYGTLTVTVGSEGSISYKYEAGLSPDKGNTQGGKDEFTFTVTDGDGDKASDVLSLNVNGWADFGFDADGFTVDESYLLMTDDDGNPIIKGTMGGEDDSQLSQSGSMHLTAGQFAEFTVNGQSITDGSSIPSSHGQMDFNVVTNADGSVDITYTYTLTGNYDAHENNAHSMGDSYNPLPEPAQGGDWDESATPSGDRFEFKVGDQSETLQINIEDDGLGEPGNMAGGATYEEVSAAYNIGLCIDISGSMLFNRADNNTAADYADSRMYAQQVSMLAMLKEYADIAGEDQVFVTMTFFGGGTSRGTTETLSYADAVKLISGISSNYQVTLGDDGNGTYTKDNHHSVYNPSGGTNYTAACNAFAELVKSLLDQDPEVRAYFFSDGNPDPASQTADKSTAWMQLLKDLTPEQLEHFNLYTVGINGSADDLTAIRAVLGALYGTEYADDVYIPQDAPVSEYIDTLISTVGIDGHIELPVSADGVIDGKAFVQSVTYIDADGQVHGGDLVPVDPNTGFPKAVDGAIDTESLSIDLPYGKIVFGVDGSFTFKPDQGTAADIPPGKNEFTFQVTFMDADGDTIVREFTYTIEGGPAEPPTIEYTFGPDSNAFEVFEAWLAGGQNEEHEDSISGELKVSKDERLSLDEVTFRYTDLDGKEHVETVKGVGDEFTIYSNDGAELGKMVIDSFDPASGTVQYTFTLTGVLDNPSGSETIAGGDYSLDDLSGLLNMGVECTFTNSQGKQYTDGNGEPVTADGSLGLTVQDDVPSAGLRADGEVVYEGSELAGTWDVAYGADGKGSEVKVVFAGAEYNIGDRIPAGEGFLTVYEDGTWKYEARDNDAYKQDDETISFSIKTTDADNDPAEDTITFSVKDAVLEGDAVSVKLTATESVYEDGDHGDNNLITYTVTLYDAKGAEIKAPQNITVTLDDGTVINIAAGETSGSTKVAYNDPDVYLEDDTVSREIATAVQEKPNAPGAFESLVPDPTPAVTEVKDTIDDTHATVSLEQTDAGVLVTISLGNPPDVGHPLTITYEVNGQEYSATFSNGQTSYTHPEAVAVQANPYGDPTEVSAELTGYSGGNYENLILDAGVREDFYVDPSEVRMTLEVADGVEGYNGYVLGKVTLSDAPTETGQITLQVQGGASVVINLVAGQTVYDNIRIPHGNAEDVYVDASDISVTASLAGGGYAGPVSDATDGAHIADTIDDTRVGLSIVDNGDGTLTITANLTSEDGFAVNVQHAPLVLALSNGTSITIPVGGVSGFVTVPADDLADGKADGQYTVEVTGAGANNYEHLDWSDAQASIDINNPPSAEDDSNVMHQGDSSVVGNLLTNDSDPDGDKLTVISAGKGEDYGNAVGQDGVRIAGKYGTVTINPDGSYSYELDNGNDAVKNLDKAALEDTFTYRISDGKGGYDTAELKISIGDSFFQAGNNEDNNINGGAGNDVLVGDGGGVITSPGTSYNVALIIDTSGSMSDQAIKDAQAALKNLVKQLAEHGDSDATVNVCLVDFSTNAAITWNGSLTSNNLNDLNAAINKLASGGGTNYEAGFNAANKWFNSLGEAATANENLVYFITDGKPTYYYLDSVPITWTETVTTDNNSGLVAGMSTSFSYNGRSATITYNANGSLTDNSNRFEFRFNTEGELEYRYSNNGNNFGSWTKTGEVTWSGTVSGQISIPNDFVLGDYVYFDAQGNRLPDSNGAAYRINNQMTNNTGNTGDGSTTLYLQSRNGNSWVNMTDIHKGEGNGSNSIYDSQSQAAYHAMLAALGGNVKVNAIGIGTGTDKNLLDPYDNTGGAQIITDASQLGATLEGGSSGNAPVGSDEIHGGAGHDVIFGDVLNADHLLPSNANGDNAWAKGLAAGDGLAILRAYLAGGKAGAEYMTGPENSVTNDDLARYIRAHAFELAPAGDTRGKGDIIHGGAGNDIIFGQGGNDVINGGSGNDIIVGGAGDHTLTGGAGSDVFVFYKGDGNDLITDFNKAEGDIIVKVDQGSGSFGNIDTGAAATSGAVYNVADILQEHYLQVTDNRAHMLVGAGTDGSKQTYDGDEYDNVLIGGNQSDVIIGGPGDNLLIGGGGNNYLQGGSGSDVILGGSGNDLIIGGGGNNILFGGAGADTFMWNADDFTADAVDKILDFSMGEGDKLSIDSLLGVSASIADDNSHLVLNLSSGNESQTIEVTFDGEVNIDGHTYDNFGDFANAYDSATEAEQAAMLNALITSITN